VTLGETQVTGGSWDWVSVSNSEEFLCWMRKQSLERDSSGVLSESIQEDDMLFDEPYEVPKEHFPACNSITFVDVVSDVSMVRAKRFFPSCNSIIFRLD